VSSGWNGISFAADRSLLGMSKFRGWASSGGSDKCGGIAALAARGVAALLELFLGARKSGIAGRALRRRRTWNPATLVTHAVPPPTGIFPRNWRAVRRLKEIDT
jgi:hypothetical protein